MTAAAPAGRFELAGAADDAALRRLLRRTPIGGAIRLSFRREPSYFAAAGLEGSRHATILLRRENGGIAAMGARSVREVYLDGEPALLGYLGQLRYAPGRRPCRRSLAAGYALARGLRRDDELPFDLTSIVADNAPARRLLERGLPGLPRYTPLTELVTLVLRARRGRRPPGVHDATPADLPAVAAALERGARGLRLAPRWTQSRLAELAAGRLGAWRPLLLQDDAETRGCAALWDQRPLRQCVVEGYAPLLRRLRPWANPALRALGRPTLPRPGTELRIAFLSHLAADDDDAACRLVAAARDRAARLGLDYLSLALPAGRPALAALRRRFGGRVYRSLLYLVHDPDFDAAALGLAGRDVGVELATL